MTPKPMDEQLKLKDRINWQRSMDKRNELINKILESGLPLTGLHNMKHQALVELAHTVERWKRK